MTSHVEFREGRRLHAADLNAESDARDTETARHQDLAHPSNGARLLGADITHPSGRPSVRLLPDGPAAGVRVALGDGPPAMEIGVSGGHHAATDVTATRSDATVVGAVRLGLRAPGPPGPAPWSVRAADVTDDDGRLVARELRVELSTPPGSPPSESRVSVGIVDAGPAFRALLSVDARGDVTVDGDLQVAGSVSQGEIQPDPEDPRFVELLADVLARRVVGVSATAADTVLHLSAPVKAASSASSTQLDVSIKPSTAIARWGAVLEVRRDGASRFAMVKVGGPAASGGTVTIPTSAISWSPPLSAAAAGRIVVAVAGFDAQGSLHAQRVDTGDLTG